MRKLFQLPFVMPEIWYDTKATTIVTTTKISELNSIINDMDKMYTKFRVGYAERERIEYLRSKAKRRLKLLTKHGSKLVNLITVQSRA